MAKKKSNPATEFDGDYRLTTDQSVFIREFIKAIRKEAKGVVKSMQRFEMSARDLAVDSAVMAHALRDFVVYDQSPIA